VTAGYPRFVGLVPVLSQSTKTADKGLRTLSNHENDSKMRRPIGFAALCVLTLTVACSDDAPNEFDTSADESATGTGTPTDVPAETGTGANDEVGDGDGDPTTGDGDGDPTTTGDGDGDPTTTTGDGDGDTGVPVCGNGVVDVGEQCDGADLNGIGCMDLGYASGDLACDPVTCTYDAAGCMAGGDGGSGGTTG
jgi:hypothetical protein